MYYRLHLFPICLIFWAWQKKYYSAVFELLTASRDCLISHVHSFSALYHDTCKLMAKNCLSTLPIFIQHYFIIMLQYIILINSNYFNFHQVLLKRYVILILMLRILEPKYFSCTLDLWLSDISKKGHGSFEYIQGHHQAHHTWLANHMVTTTKLNSLIR